MSLDTKESITKCLEELKAKRSVLQGKIKELDTAIDGLNMALKLFRGTGGQAGSRGHLIDAIRSLLDEAVEPLTAGAMESRIAGQFPDSPPKLSSISSALSKMAKAGTIKLVQKGGGKRPALYSRKDSEGVTAPV